MIDKGALRIRVVAFATGGTYDYPKSEIVPRGEKWHIHRHSFENKTGARGTIRGYIDRLGYKHWLWEQTSPAAATLYWSEEDLTLVAGERFGIRQASATASDELELLMEGDIEYLEGGG